jgi:hypothetical protein
MAMNVLEVQCALQWEVSVKRTASNATVSRDTPADNNSSVSG